MRTLTTLLAATAATALTAAAPALAQDTYVRIGGGYALSADGEANFVGTFIGDPSVMAGDSDGDGLADNVIVANVPETKLLVDGGFTGSVTAGRMFGQFGLEAEVRYDNLGIDGIGDRQDFISQVITNPDFPEENLPNYSLSEDDFSSVFAMANIVAEFNDGYDDFMPYVAAGIGVGFHEVLDDDDTGMAYQLKAGVAKDFGGFQGGLEFAYLWGSEISPDPEGLTQTSFAEQEGVFTGDITDFNVPVERTSLRVFVGTSF